MDNRPKILIIDDELAPRESLRMVLKDKYVVSTASGAHEGFDIMAQCPMDLVVLDIKMPQMDGITALKEIKKRHPDTEVILLTAFASLETARIAVRYGAFDYLMKPFNKDDLINIVEKGLQKRYTRESSRLEHETLAYRSKFLEEEVAKARQDIIECYEGTVKALNLTIDAKDHYTYNHSSRVAELSSLLAKELGLSEGMAEKVKYAAAIHDIGKIGVSESILRKEGYLEPDELREIRTHTEIGATIVQSIPFLEDAVPVIRYHHENYDGSGYPEGIKGEQIPLTARIVKVADAVDAMLHARPYRDGLPVEKVLSELRDNAGTQFDPAVVDVILQGKISLK
ncbi:MAG: HD domain-containing phosphohydrolase [Candidatus Scalindua sp.]